MFKLMKNDNNGHVSLYIYFLILKICKVNIMKCNNIVSN